MTPMAERSPVESGRVVRNSPGGMGRLEIDRSKHVVAKHERRSGAAKHVLASPYGIFEILTEANHAKKQPRLKLRTWSTGKQGHMRR